jgi:hypothetical protein
LALKEVDHEREIQNNQDLHRSTSKSTLAAALTEDTKLGLPVSNLVLGAINLKQEKFRQKQEDKFWECLLHSQL